MQIAQSRTAWCYFPHAMIMALGIVVIVNSYMIWTALHTFPGVAAIDVFDHSNVYDEVLAQAKLEAALGWSVEPLAESRAPLLTLAGPDGKSLCGATIVGEARRPLGPDLKTPLTFFESTPGRYVASAALPALGQWELRMTITKDGKTLHATRRIVAK